MDRVPDTLALEAIQTIIRLDDHGISIGQFGDQCLVLDRGGETLLRIERPFRFYFHTAQIFDGSGRLIGTLQRHFSVLRRLYSVLSPSANNLFDLFGPLFHPWTFEIVEGGRQRGKIQKKWTGLAKEAFTDADNFGVTFPSDWPVERKTLALGAVFLIDFVHFENKGNR